MERIQHSTFARLFIALLLLLTVNTITAQRCLPVFEIGVQAGPGISTAYGPGVTKDPLYKYGTGFGAALVLQGNFKKWFGIRTGVMFERRGFRTYEKDAMSVEPTTYKYFNRFDYVNIPILLQFMTGCKTALVLQGGGFLGLLYHNQRVQKERNINEVNGPGYYTFDGGISVGAGLRIPFFKKLVILTLEARNNTGLSALYRASTNNDRVYVNHTYLMAGLNIGLGRK